MLLKKNLPLFYYRSRRYAIILKTRTRIFILLWFSDLFGLCLWDRDDFLFVCIALLTSFDLICQNELMSKVKMYVCECACVYGSVLIGEKKHPGLLQTKRCNLSSVVNNILIFKNNISLTHLLDRFQKCIYIFMEK